MDWDNEKVWRYAARTLIYHRNNLEETGEQARIVIGEGIGCEVAAAMTHLAYTFLINYLGAMGDITDDDGWKDAPRTFDDVVATTLDAMLENCR